MDILLSPEAIDHLSGFTTRERRIILDAIEIHLAHEPITVTQQRKPLRPNPLASWELRVGHFRVYYQVESANGEDVVYVVAVGTKVRNRVIVGGKELQL